MKIIRAISLTIGLIPIAAIASLRAGVAPA
jgi:hypothetical protein